MQEQSQEAVARLASSVVVAKRSGPSRRGTSINASSRFGRSKLSSSSPFLFLPAFMPSLSKAPSQDNLAQRASARSRSSTKNRQVIPTRLLTATRVFCRPEMVQSAGPNRLRRLVPKPQCFSELDPNLAYNAEPTGPERVMSINGNGDLKTVIDPPKAARRLQTNVRTLVVLVACCGLSLWAARRLWENYDPVQVEARSIQKRAIGILQSGKPAERVDAIHELERLKAGDRAVAIPPLLGALEDPEIEVRVAAADALGSFGRIARKSQSGQEAVRNAATALIRCLEDPQPGVRAAATTSLGLIALPSNHQDVMDALATVLGDRDAKVRLAAIKALVSLRSGTGPPKALLSALDDESAENRATAIRSLRIYRQGLNPFVPALLRVGSKEPDPTVQDEISMIWANAVLTPPAVTADVVPFLIASLRSSDFKVRVLAASLLRQFGAAANKAIPELVRVLNEPLEPGVATMANKPGIWDPAIEATLALRRIAPGSAEAKTVVAALMEVARSGPPSRRALAASALEEFGADAAGAVPVLIHLVDLNEPLDPKAAPDATEIFDAAAWALGRIAPRSAEAKKVIAALMEVVRSGPPSRRARAARVLGNFGPDAAEAVPVLLHLVHLNEPLVPKAAPDATEIFDAAVSALSQIAPGSAEAKKVIAALIEVGAAAPAADVPRPPAPSVNSEPMQPRPRPFWCGSSNNPSQTRMGTRRWRSLVRSPRSRPTRLRLARPLPYFWASSRSKDMPKDWQFRVFTLQALELFGPSAAAAAPRIRALRGDRDADVRNAAAKALDAIENQSTP